MLIFFFFATLLYRKAELERQIKEPQVVEPVVEEELPPGQIRDEHGVIWQVNIKDVFLLRSNIIILFDDDDDDKVLLL